jgi:magnesium transporter
MTDKNLQSLADKIRHRPGERLEIFRSVEPMMQSLVIAGLSKHLQYDILSHLHKEEIVQLMNHLDPDSATDLLQLLPRRRQDAIIRELDEQLANDITLLLPFDPDTAAGLMNLDYIQTDEHATVADIAKRFKTHEKRTGRLPTVILTKEGKITGFLPGHQLGFARPSERVNKYKRKIITVKHSASTDEVVDMFRVHPHDKAVVLGETGNVLGVIYSDDVLRVLKEQESASLYDFAGVREEEDVNDPARRKIKYRYKWLIINLGTAFLAAFTVGMFDEIINNYVLLAVYMPIVAGMGGNAATQTLAVMVRGIALKQVSFKTVKNTLKSEVGAGLANGFINGLLVAGVVYLLNRDWKIGLILAMAMVINLSVAAIFGTIVPLIMKSLGKDPAASATIFITTATDVLGFFAFLSLATIILS